MPNSLGFRAFVCLLLAISGDDVVRGQTLGLNAIVSFNGQTTLDCQTSFLAASTWIRTIDGYNNPLLISSNCIVAPSNAAYYSTTLLGGDICRLIIGNVTMQQAGVYDCNPGSGGGSYRSLVTVIDHVASLIVYNQSEVVENDHLNISCSINYSAPVSPAPLLRPSPSWTTAPGQNFVSTKYYPSTNIVTLVATVTVKKPTVPIFQCNTAFEIIGSTAGYNLTAPQDHFSVGNTIVLDVQYGPSKPSSTSRASVITFSSVPCGIGVLTCSSTANPAPNYRWLDSEGTVLSTSSILTLAEVNRTYKCEASNNIRKTWHSVSENFTVSEDNCSSSVQCCVFPHNDTTTVNYARDCENGTALCDCSQDKSAIILLCNVTTYPNASYMWSASGVPKVGPTNSSKYVDATANDTYRCLAYFDRSSSNYSGDVIFPNGTNDKAVDKCSGRVGVLVASAVVPYVGGNFISLIAYCVFYYTHISFRYMMDNRFPVIEDKVKVVLLVIASVLCGLILIPIAVTIAFCSSLRQVGSGKEEITLGETENNHQEEVIPNHLDNKVKKGAAKKEGIGKEEITLGETENNHQEEVIPDQDDNKVKKEAEKKEGVATWMIVLMWFCDIILLFPTSFVVVYFVDYI